MKRRIFAAVVCIVLAVVCLTACGKDVSDVDPNPFVGEWAGEAWINEVWTFEKNGTGSNENDLWSYDFEYTYIDGQLNIYQEFLGSISDEPYVYDVQIDGDNIIIYDIEWDTEYVLVKQ